MSYRFTSNNAIGVNSSEYLKYLYDFMTAASPTGPGWVSVGESNGTIGGMGVTGIINSVSDLSSVNAWYVLQRPDGLAQFLYIRGSGYQMGMHYSKGALFTGGSSISLPTASDVITWPIVSYVLSAGYFNAVANDTAPYSFVHWGHVASSITIGGGHAYIGLNTYEPIDNDPYVNHFRGYYSNFLTHIESVGCAVLRDCWTWSPNGQYSSEIDLLGLGSGSNKCFPQSPPTDVNGNPVLIDCIFSQSNTNYFPLFYKGTSNFIKWADISFANGTRNFGGAFIKINNFWVPWNDTVLL